MDGLAAALAAAAAAGVDGDAVARANEQLSRLHAEGAAAALSAAVAQTHTPGDLPALTAAIDAAARSGAAAAGPLAEAQARYARIERDDRARREIDALLGAALAGVPPDSAQLEMLVRAADVAGVTSEVIEAARAAVAEVRAAVHRGRLAGLLRGAMRLRSVEALQAAVRSAAAAGGGGRRLGRAQRYLRRLQASAPGDIAEEEDEDDEDDEEGDDEEDDDEEEDEDEEGSGDDGGLHGVWQAEAPPTPAAAPRLAASDAPDKSPLAHALTTLFEWQCRLAEAAGVPPPHGRLLRVAGLGAVWRALRGGDAVVNLHRDVQLFQRFDVAQRGELTLQEYLDGWATLAEEVDGEEDGPEMWVERIRNTTSFF